MEWSEAAKWTGIMHSYDDGHERNERASEGASGVGRRSSGLGGGLRRRLQRAQLQPRLGDDDLATSRFDDKNKLLFARVGNGQSVGRLVLEGSMIGGVRGENGDIAYRLRVSNPATMWTMMLVSFQVQGDIVAISTRMFC